MLNSKLSTYAPKSFGNVQTRISAPQIFSTPTKNEKLQTCKQFDMENFQVDTQEELAKKILAIGKEIAEQEALLERSRLESD